MVMFCSNVFVGDVRIVAVADRGSGKWNYALREGTIFVHNLSYHKEVGFHIQVDGKWIDLPASYSHALLTGEGRTIEVWKYESHLAFASEDLTQPLKAFQLAVFYHNLDWGTSYWDNNFARDVFNQDYFIKAIAA